MATASQPIQYFGRGWQITISPQAGGTTYTIASQATTPTLRVVFSIETVLLQPVRQAKVVIYNLGNIQTTTTPGSIGGGSAFGQMTAAQQSGTPLAVDNAIQLGDKVTIAAGYQSGSGSAATFNATANLLYNGVLLQSIPTRENVTDTKLTLRCITNLAAAQWAFANFPRSKGVTDYTVLLQALQAAGVPVGTIDSITQQALQGQSYSRGQAVFDRPLNTVSDIAKQHRAFYWYGPNGELNMKALGDGGTITAAQYTYGPPNLSSYTRDTVNPGTIKPTMLGYPEGTQYGVVFRVLMDPQVLIGDAVQIAPGTAINSFQINYNPNPSNNSPNYPLPNAQGTYLVSGIRHVGDTRGIGDDWYTEITAMTPQFFQNYVKVYTPSGN